MELRQIRFFLEVAQAGSISRAAQNVYLTQPALSRQIKALETELGQCLLEREAHSVKLTPAGEVLLREGQKLLNLAEKVRDRVQQAGMETRLKLGYAPSLSNNLLPPAIEAFTARHPKVQIELHDLSSQEILKGLDEGSLDLGITVLPWQETRTLQWTKLFETPLLLAISKNHPLASKQRATLDDLADQKFLVYQRQAYPEYWRHLAKWLEGHQIRASITGEFDGVHSLLAAVKANLGVAVVAQCTDDIRPQDVRFLPLDPAPTPIPVAVGCHLDQAQAPILQTFIANLKLEVESLLRSES